MSTADPDGRTDPKPTNIESALLPASTILIAISGPTCSGKTTISRLLRDALVPHALILHEDDFYKPDAAIPLKTTSTGATVQDWDCAASLDLPGLEAALQHVRAHGTVPPGFESIQDRNPVGEVDVDEAVVRRWKETFAASVKAGLKVVIVDGFLLFAEAVAVLRPLFDAKVLLRAPYREIKRRRESRQGYVTQEGFWQDPPGYVDEVVWPNYVKDHKFLFRSGDVEGEIAEDVCKEMGIRVLDGRLAENGNMTAVLEWVAGVILGVLEHQQRSETA